MRRYFVTTFGCQMNAHDSERIKGTLESLGLGEAPSRDQADVLVFNTCTIREKPDTKFAAYMGDAAARKRARPGRDRRRRRLLRRGAARAAVRRSTRSSTSRSARARSRTSPTGSAQTAGRRAVDVRDRDERVFPAGLPMHRERRFQAWVQVSMGCNSTCAYCIVPAVRGREVSRRPGEIVAEVTALASEGVREVTLLGQNVNSWGRDLRPDIVTEFGELLRAVDAVDGIERIRFTSPHPKDFREPVIAAMAECAAVCEHIHLPLQSGSTRVLKAMRRTYSQERYLALVERLRAAVPDLALGDGHHRRLPGRDRGGLRRDAGRRGGGALRQRVHVHLLAARGHRGSRDAEQVAEEVKHDRLERLVEVVQRIAAERNASARRPRRGGARRGPQPHRPGGRCAAARGATRPSTSPAARRPASSSRARSTARRRRRCAARSSPRPRPERRRRRRRLRADRVGQDRGRAALPTDRLGGESSPPTRCRSTAACRSSRTAGAADARWWRSGRSRTRRRWASTPSSRTRRSTSCSPPGATPVVAGGTGLYFRAALADLEFPPAPPPGARERWERRYDADGRPPRTPSWPSATRKPRPSSTRTTGAGSSGRSS